MGIAKAPVQVRNHDAEGVEMTNGAFMSAALPVTGLAIIEAVILPKAIEFASRRP